MATTPPSARSRTSSSSSTSSISTSTSTTSSRSPSPTYRLSPRSPDPQSYDRYLALPPPYQYRESRAPQPSHPPSSPTFYSTLPDHRHRHRQSYNAIDTASPPRTSLPTSPSRLSTSIERVTLPMLAHLNHELRLTHLEAERDRVRRQIQRQETVLTLSMLLKVWGG